MTLPENIGCKLIVKDSTMKHNRRILDIGEHSAIK